MDILTQFQADRQRADFVIGDVGLQTDSGLNTAILISLFSDGRQDGQGGWWGDSYPDDSGLAQASSLLWTLRRAKLTPDTLREAERLAKAALQWIVEDGLAGQITVSASIPRADWLALDINLQRPSGPLRWSTELLWSSYV